MGILAYPNGLDVEPNREALSKSLSLIKTGLIYGEDLEVSCPNCSVVLQQIGYRDATPAEAFDNLAKAAAFCNLNPEQYESARDVYASRQTLRATRRRLKNDKARLKEFDTLAERVKLEREEDRQRITSWLEKVEHSEKLELLARERFINFNLLEIPFRLLGDITILFNKGRFSSAFYQEAMSTILDKHTLAYGRALAKYTLEPNWLPLFDDKVKEIAESTQRTASLQGKKLHFEGSIHEATGINYLLNRLPRFREMEMTEALAVRKELAPYTKRFRKTILEMLETAQQENLLGSTFIHEIESWASQTLDPLVEEINEISKQNSITKLFLDKKQVWAGTAASLGVVFSLQMPKLTLAASAIGAGRLVYEAYRENQTQQAEAKKSGCYLYYRLSK